MSRAARGAAARRRAAGVAILLLVAAAGCGRAPIPRAADAPTVAPDAAARAGDEPGQGSQAGCLPRFPDTDGWLGGDAAWSVALPPPREHTSLWLFGDSFVARPAQGPGRRYPLVPNTIALARCPAPGAWSFAPSWDRSEPDAPRAFFRPDPTALWVERVRRETGRAPWYWPFDGFVVDGRVYVGLLRVAAAPPRGPFRLPFRILGMDLARIRNADDPPARWRIERVPLAGAGRAFPASAFVVEGDWLYAFGFHEGGDGPGPRIVGRLPLARLAAWPADLREAWQTLAADGRWRAGWRPAEALALMEDDATEMSVHWDAASARWLAVYATPGSDVADGPPDHVWIRSAPRLAGPWSARQSLHVIPGSRPDRATSASASASASPPETGDPVGRFCYAAKAHPQYERPGRLLVTWVCSLFAPDAQAVGPVLERLAATPGLYRARAVSLPVPAFPSVSEGASVWSDAPAGSVAASTGSPDAASAADSIGGASAAAVRRAR